MSIITINPATGENLEEYREYEFDEINAVIEKSHSAYLSWKETGFAKRTELMKKAAAILRGEKEEFGRLMALEMGKPLAQGIAESEKCAWVCDYYAENAEKQLADYAIETEMKKSYVAFRPQGVVLAIMPWNFPFWQVFRFAAPTLMAGNGGVLKHSSNTMGCALAIEKIFTDAGFPEGLFGNLTVSSKPMPKVMEHHLITAVTLTGSTPVGQKVAEKAGSLIKKTVLELGGSDPYVVLEDADLEKTVDSCVTARLINSGQSCIAAKRFIVAKEIYDEFVELFTDKMKSKSMGNPLSGPVDVGPQARKDLQLDLHRQVESSIQKGARLTLGGFIPDDAGYYYPPTVLADVEKGMAAYEEETFGPVAAIIKATDENDAIDIANDTEFGLGAAVFTDDLKRGENIARNKLNAGCCFVNDFVRSDPRLPFGGAKMSGYGRELSLFGIREFVNAKTVVVM